ncbi:hypothetical protein MKW92_037445, partial [Papaver armeniacum]
MRRHTIFVHTSEEDEHSAFHEDVERRTISSVDEEEYSSYEVHVDEDYPSRKDDERPVPGLEYEDEIKHTPETPHSPPLQQPMLFMDEYKEELETRTKVEVEPEDCNNGNL